MAKQWGTDPKTGLITLLADDGQPDTHWLLKNWATRQAEINAEKAKIQARQNDPENRRRFSPEGLRDIVAGHVATIARIKTEGEAADLQQARDEWAGIQAKRDELLTQRRKQIMSDISPVEYENAKDELSREVKKFSNVREIAGWIETITDPAKRIAAHSLVEELARKRFPNDPANGSLGGKLERDRTAYFETEASRAQLEKAETLREGAFQTGIQAHREHNNDHLGQGGIHAAWANTPGKYHAQLEGLYSEIADYLGIDDLSRAEEYFVTTADGAGGYFNTAAAETAAAIS